MVRGWILAVATRQLRALVIFPSRACSPYPGRPPHVSHLQRSACRVARQRNYRERLFRDLSDGTPFHPILTPPPSVFIAPLWQGEQIDHWLPSLRFPVLDREASDAICCLQTKQKNPSEPEGDIDCGVARRGIVAFLGTAPLSRGCRFRLWDQLADHTLIPTKSKAVIIGTQLGPLPDAYGSAQGGLPSAPASSR